MYHDTYVALTICESSRAQWYKALTNSRSKIDPHQLIDIIVDKKKSEYH